MQFRKLLNFFHIDTGHLVNWVFQVDMSKRTIFLPLSSFDYKIVLSSLDNYVDIELVSQIMKTIFEYFLKYG